MMPRIYVQLDLLTKCCVNKLSDSVCTMGKLKCSFLRIINFTFQWPSEGVAVYGSQLNQVACGFQHHVAWEDLLVLHNTIDKMGDLGEGFEWVECKGNHARLIKALDCS